MLTAHGSRFAFIYKLITRLPSLYYFTLSFFNIWICDRVYLLFPFDFLDFIFIQKVKYLYTK